MMLGKESDEMYIRQLVEAIMSTRKDLYVLISIDDNNEYWTMDVLTEAYTIVY